MFFINRRVKSLIIGLISVSIVAIALAIINKDTNEEMVPETPSLPNVSEDYNKESESVPEQEEQQEQQPEQENSNKEEFTEYQKEVLHLVNIQRIEHGLNPLSLDYKLSEVATFKSQDMIYKNYFDHNSPTYGSPYDMMDQFGISYVYAGENIAWGQRNPQMVVEAWMNSKSHRENILNPNFTTLGVGIAEDLNGSIYWTQMFIGE